MCPRTGRPTSDPRNRRLEIRLTETEYELLEKESVTTGKTKTEILLESYADSCKRKQENQITGEELKKRLLREYDNLGKLNEMEEDMIIRLKGNDYIESPNNNRDLEIRLCEEKIKENTWLRKVIKNQLKRDFGYEIKE